METYAEWSENRDQGRVQAILNNLHHLNNWLANSHMPMDYKPIFDQLRELRQLLPAQARLVDQMIDVWERMAQAMAGHAAGRSNRYSGYDPGQEMKKAAREYEHFRYLEDLLVKQISGQGQYGGQV